MILMVIYTWMVELFMKIRDERDQNNSIDKESISRPLVR